MNARKEPERVLGSGITGLALDCVVSEEENFKLKISAFIWVPGASYVIFQSSTPVALVRLNITHLPLPVVPLDTSQQSVEGGGLPKCVHPALFAFLPFSLEKQSLSFTYTSLGA